MKNQLYADLHEVGYFKYEKLSLSTENSFAGWNCK